MGFSANAVKIFLLLLVLSGVAEVGADGSKTAPQKTSQKSLTNAQRYQNLELFQKVLHFVENNYVDQVDHDRLIRGAIKGMLENLDPHSNFLPPDVFRDMKADTSGRFGGLGIEITAKDGVLTVIAPIEDTPAWKAGIKSADRIVKIDGVSTKGMSVSEAASKMRGKKGTRVVLSIYRKGFDRVRDVPLVRAEIRVRTVRHEVMEPGYGYVRLSSFPESAADDIRKAIQKLEKENKGPMKGMILDLRGNPGGLLEQAVDVSSLFVDDGVIVSTIGRNRDQKEVKHAKKGRARKDFQLAVLVNSSTASAAEIVAGALQDHRRAVIMGQPTFGKGSVQSVIELGQEMGLKLTIARYYTPSGRSIQEKGVVPDLTLDEFDEKLLSQARLIRERTREKDLPGHISGEYSVEELSDSLSPVREGADGASSPGDSEDMEPINYDPKRDSQVREAVNYLKSFDIFKRILDKES